MAAWTDELTKRCCFPGPGLKLLVPACCRASAHHEEQVQISEHVPLQSASPVSKAFQRNQHALCTSDLVRQLMPTQEDRECKKDQQHGRLSSKRPQLNQDGHDTGTDCAVALLCSFAQRDVSPQHHHASQAVPSPCLSSPLPSLASADISATRSTSTVPTKPPE